MQRRAARLAQCREPAVRKHSYLGRSKERTKERSSEQAQAALQRHLQEICLGDFDDEGNSLQTSTSGPMSFVRAAFGQVQASKASDRARALAAPSETGKVHIAQAAHRDAQWIPESYAALMHTNDYRERLLDDARRYSPISSVFHMRKLPQTVIVRMLTFPVVWSLVGLYVVIATLTRLAIVDFGDADDFDVGAFDGAEVLVVFMVVFYLGYCYNRYFEMCALKPTPATRDDRRGWVKGGTRVAR